MASFLFLVIQFGLVVTNHLYHYNNGSAMCTLFNYNTAFSPESIILDNQYWSPLSVYIVFRIEYEDTRIDYTLAIRHLS